MDTQILIFAAAIVVFLISLVTIVVLMVWSSAPRGEDRLGSLSEVASRRSGKASGRATGSRYSTTSTSHASNPMASRLVQAGLYRRNSVGYYVFVKSMFALVPAGLGLAAYLMNWLSLLQGVGGGIAIGLLGTLLPSFWLDMQKNKRQTALNRALPDALDVIVVCLEAGLSLRAAVSRVAKELQAAHPLLAAELLIAEREIQLGCSGGEAFKRFADRFDLEPLRSLASVITQAEKFGASIAKALRVHADDLRVKRFQMAEERAQKASVKLLFPTLLLIFPTLYVVLLGPAVIEMMRFFTEFGK